MEATSPSGGRTKGWSCHRESGSAGVERATHPSLAAGANAHLPAGCVQADGPQHLP